MYWLHYNVSLSKTIDIDYQCILSVQVERGNPSVYNEINMNIMWYLVYGLFPEASITNVPIAIAKLQLFVWINIDFEYDKKSLHPLIVKLIVNRILFSKQDEHVRTSEKVCQITTFNKQTKHGKFHGIFFYFSIWFYVQSILA